MNNTNNNRKLYKSNYNGLFKIRKIQTIPEIT